MQVGRNGRKVNEASASGASVFIFNFDADRVVMSISRFVPRVYIIGWL